MPRLESHGRFWEVVLDGTTVHTRSGETGTDGAVTEPKTFRTRAEAEKDIATRVASQKSRGFTIVSVELTEPSNAEMERAIVDDPQENEREGRFLVYADWLQSIGHPRGELAMLQHTRAKNPDDAALAESEAKLLEKHPELAPQRVLEMARARGTGESVTLRWENGFIVAARLSRGTGKPLYTIRELTAELLAHPAARLLRELRIGALGPTSYYLRHDAVVGEIVRARPRALRLLSIVDAVDAGYTALGDLAGLPEAAPELRDLLLDAHSVKIGPIEFPKLERLRFTCRSTESASSFVKAVFPSIEELVLDCGDAELDSKTISKLFDKSWRKLRRLGLRRIGNANAVVAALVKSKLPAKLESLDLSGGRLDGEGGNAILTARASFARLTKLDVSRNLLDASTASRMKTMCADVVAEPQRSPTAVTLRESDVEAFALDPSSLTKGRALAQPERWPVLGREDATFWGHCQGSDLYEVYLRVPELAAGCTCPSRNRPCKHAIALAFLVATGHAFPDARIPAGLISRADASRRYTATRE